MDADAMAAASSSSASYSKQRIIQNFLLIFIDVGIDKSTEKYRNALIQFQNVVNDVHIFTQTDKAIDFLTDTHDVNAFLIVKSTIGQDLLPLIHDILQLDTIYILGDNQSSSEEWIKKWIKIKGIHKDITSICEALPLETKQCDQDAIAVSFITTDHEVSNVNLNQLECSFMYTQIFKESLLDINYDDKSIKVLTDYCRRFYSENVRQLNIIKEFEDKYRSESPIWWYTRECFLYQMLNRALRTLETDTIINMGFFIRDLHQRIQELHHKQKGSDDGKTFIVYRGQGLSVTDFDQIRRTQGGLISFNNFLSTSTKRDVSLTFARRALPKTNMIGILFRMTIDLSVSSTPFAFISEDSYLKKEEEILFSMHTVFRIGEINKIDSNCSLYQVELKLTDDDDKELRILTECTRAESSNKTGWNRVGVLLLNLNKFDKAEELYHVLLEQTSDPHEMALYYSQLGYIKSHQGDYVNAIEDYKKGIEIKERILPANDISFAKFYGNIGTVYLKMGDNANALSFHNKALGIKTKTYSPDHPDLAMSYSNIGLVYQSMGEYSKALSFHEKGLKIREETLPSNHPMLTSTYNNIGTIYTIMLEYSKALLVFEKALAIQHKVLPVDHPLLATSYNNIGLLYTRMQEYSKGHSFLQKALEIMEKTLPANHPSFIDTYNNIGLTDVKTGEHSKALSFLEKAIEIVESILPINHPSSANCYTNIATVYHETEEYSKALPLYQKALAKLLKTHPEDHPDAAIIYCNLAVMYESMKEYSKALSYYEKAEKIWRNVFPANYPYLELVQEKIETLKDMINANQ